MRGGKRQRGVSRQQDTVEVCQPHLDSPGYWWLWLSHVWMWETGGWMHLRCAHFTCTHLATDDCNCHRCGCGRQVAGCIWGVSTSPVLTCLLMTATVTSVDVGNRWQDAFGVCQPHLDSPAYWWPRLSQVWMWETGGWMHLRCADLTWMTTSWCSTTCTCWWGAWGRGRRRASSISWTPLKPSSSKPL